MIGDLDPMRATDGRPVFTALVKPMADGKLLVCVMMSDDDCEDPANGEWVSHELESDEARAMAAEIEDAFVAGGGKMKR